VRSKNFIVKADLTTADLENSLLWAGYYEPDEIADIVSWGYSESEVRAAFEAVGWEDGWFFPLPLEAKDTSWFRGKLFGIEATTKGGVVLAGLVLDIDPASVDLFYNSTRYCLSAIDSGRLLQALGGRSDQPDALCRALGNADIYPLTIRNLVNGESFSFTPNLVRAIPLGY
jgi:hypothetical protein